jgi:protein TonB
MRTAACFVLISAILAPGLLAQTQVSTAKAKEPTSSFCKKVENESQYTSISAGVAEKLLIQKVDPAWKHLPMEGRVSGTVVIRFVLGKQGEVFCPRVISGPKLLQQSVLSAVRQYKYKPYMLSNGEAIAVTTTVSVTTSNY